jgi:hypothetical protein
METEVMCWKEKLSYLVLVVNQVYLTGLLYMLPYITQQICTLTDQGAAICYLDEKWFYLFSCCQKSKHLP